MEVGDIQAIAAKYHISDWRLLPSWLRSRNVSAHHARLWNRSLPYVPKLPSPGKMPNLDHLVGHRLAHHRLYAPTAITQHFLSVLNSRTTWSGRLKDHFDTFPTAPGALSR
jgi:abortive infection bacteriophage resistance protein